MFILKNILALFESPQGFPVPAIQPGLWKRKRRTGRGTSSLARPEILHEPLYPSKWQMGLGSSLDPRSHRSLPSVAGKLHGGAPSSQKLQHQEPGGRGSDQASIKEACGRGLLGREASYLPTHYEVRAPKRLQGGKEGVHLVSTHHVPGGVLGTVHGQPCLIPTEARLSPARSSMESTSQNASGKAPLPRGKEVWSETAGALPLPQGQCTVGKGDGGLTPPNLGGS